MNSFQLDNKNNLILQDICNFSGKGFDKSHEIGECSVAVQIIPYVNNVLEIGGGTGKVSHMINKKLSERGLEKKHVVVEPGVGGNGNHGDYYIYANKAAFGDKYTIVKKFADELTLADFSVLGVPDCLYVDCEGCLNSFFKTDIGVYVLKNVRYIVNEMDGYNEELRTVWSKYGFKKIAEGYGCGTACVTEIWSKQIFENIEMKSCPISKYSNVYMGIV
jgi:hypothetical protein